jgi:hypothetical protein
MKPFDPDEKRDYFLRWKYPDGQILQHVFGRYAYFTKKDPDEYRELRSQWPTWVPKMLIKNGDIHHHIRDHYDEISFELKIEGSEQVILSKEEFVLLARLNFKNCSTYEELSVMIRVAKYYGVPLDNVDQVRVAYRLDQ